MAVISQADGAEEHALGGLGLLERGAEVVEPLGPAGVVDAVEQALGRCRRRLKNANGVVGVGAQLHRLVDRRRARRRRTRPRVRIAPAPDRGRPARTGWGRPAAACRSSRPSARAPRMVVSHSFALELAPGEQREPAARPEARGDVGERGDRVAEEHGAEVADGDVGGLRLERVHLGVALHEGDVGRRPRPPPAPARRRASARTGRCRAPSRRAASWAASIVDRPVPQPMSSTRSPVADDRGVDQVRPVPPRRALVARRRARSSASPSWPSHASNMLDVGDVHGPLPPRLGPI